MVSHRYRINYERNEIREALAAAEVEAKERRDMLLEHLGIIAAAVDDAIRDLHHLAQAIVEMQQEVKGDNKLASR